jgi:hypothetical protein
MIRTSELLLLSILAASLVLVSCQKAGTKPSFQIRLQQSAETVEVYDYVEVALMPSPATVSNPFTDASLTGRFELQDESRHWDLEGFSDSDDGSVYRIRFMPQVPGAYRYALQFRTGNALQTATGRFQVVKGSRRGPIRIDTQYPFHFVWQGTGEHYFFNGTTAYWLMGWADEKVIQSSIERLHRLKVNRMRVTLAGRTNLGYGEAIWPGDRWTPFLTPWPSRLPEDVYHPGFDYSRFYLPHWQRFDRMLRFARDRDMVISIVLDMNDSRTHPTAGSDDEKRFLKYAVARLGAFSNITWDLGDDLDSYRSDPWTHQTGEMIESWDPYHHLATSHPVNPEHQDAASNWFGFTSFQQWSRKQHRFMLLQRWRQTGLGRIIPQTNEEYGYEDHRPLWLGGSDLDSADVLRRTAWDIAMAGGYQTTGESTRRGTNILPDTGGGWVNGRGDDTMTMLEGYAHMVDFFTSFEWWKTEPHDELVDKGAYCLAYPGRIYVAYLPHAGSVRIELKPGTYDATWFDPATGIRTPIGAVKGPTWASPTAPDDKDWALLLQASARRD